MKTTLARIQWKNHIMGISFFLIALAICLLAYWSWATSSEQLQQTNTQRASQQAINTQYFNAQQTLDTYLDHYDGLRQNGLIAKPNKLDWIENLRTITQSNAIPRVEFNVHKQHTANMSNDLFFSDNFTVIVTPMNITADLLHEGDFFKLYTALRNHAAGRYIIRNCTIRRVDKIGIPKEFRPLSSNCQLDWYNIDDPNASESSMATATAEAPLT